MSLDRLDAAIAARGGPAAVLASPDDLTLIRGDTVALEPVKWLWKWFLPAGMLTILAGAPGCGKTTIALSLSATVTNGGTWPDGWRCDGPGDVLVWSGEDAPAVLAARLKASGANMARVHFVSDKADGRAFDPRHDMQALEAAAAKLRAPRLLILDPVVSAVAGDSHKNAEVRQALEPAVRLGQRLGCAVLGVTHFTKGSGGRDPAERVTGSLAFVALARMVLVAAKVRADEEGQDKRVLMRAKSNIGPDDGGFCYGLSRVEVAPDVEGQRVDWGDPIKGAARDVLTEAEADDVKANESDNDTNDADNALKRCLGRDVVPSAEVRRAMRQEGFSDKQTRAARERVGLIVKRKGFGKDAASYWTLPDGAVLPTDDAPFVPAEAHSCPLMPTNLEGTSGHKCLELGTSEPARGDDAEAF